MELYLQCQQDTVASRARIDLIDQVIGGVLSTLSSGGRHANPCPDSQAAWQAYLVGDPALACCLLLSIHWVTLQCTTLTWVEYLSVADDGRAVL